jgi:prepilin-type processing-associated H-X9-DG protein
VELSSLHFYYGWNPKRMVGNALFADGSAAVVGTPPAGTNDWTVAATGSCLFADSEYAMGWNVGDHGFDMTLSTKVPALIQQNLRPWVEQWLGENGLTIAEVGSWAVHPGGRGIGAATRGHGRVQAGPGRAREHVEPDRALHPKRVAAGKGTAAVRGAGVRAGAGGGGSFVPVTKDRRGVSGQRYSSVPIR